MKKKGEVIMDLQVFRTNQSLRGLPFAIVASLGCFACSLGSPGDSRESVIRSPERPLAILHAELRGDIGPLRGFSDDEAMHRGKTENGNYHQVEVLTESDVDGRRAFVIFDISGDMGPDTLPVGTTIDQLRGEGSELMVYGLACSGPSVATDDFEVLADRVRFSVVPGSLPDSRTFNFAATFVGDPATGQIQTASGSFELPDATFAPAP